MIHTPEKPPRQNPRASRASLALLAISLIIASVPSQTAAAQSAQTPASPSTADLASARQSLAAQHFARAKQQYAAYLRAHPASVDAELGLADCDLALHEYEAAEWDYRRVVAAQPQLWVAHKNLVIVEAALGRWSEFERERTVLRDARERGAPGISARESDVIDGFDVHGHHWLVREYFEPVGRSEARFNFTRFTSAGKVVEYISLEPTAAAQAALQPGDVRIGGPAPPFAAKGEFSLNWYTGHAHGTIAHYPHGQPTYEKTRADVLRWLRRAK
jgi:hypothetical protein